jgi:hypothetical protein
MLKDLRSLSKIRAYLTQSVKVEDGFLVIDKSWHISQK